MTTIELLKQASSCVYAAVDEPVAKELSAIMTQAASELSALQRSLNGIKQEAKSYKDDHLKCVHWCCENGLGESTDNATDEVLKQLSALQKENAELKDANRRANAAIGDTSNELQEIINSLRTQNRELREMCKVKDEALQLVTNLDFNYTAGMALAVKKALALQPEK